LQSLRREIELYDPRLSKRPWSILANKIDLPQSAENLQAVRERFPNIPLIPVSAAHGEGIIELKCHLGEWLAESGTSSLAPEDVESGEKEIPINV